MNLVMFDIDGTLTQSCDFDSDCFCKAVCEVLGLATINSDWAQYKNVTDSGIAAEIIRIAFGRRASRADLSRIRLRFSELIAEHLSGAHRLEIPGAAALLTHLRSRPDTVIAFATGGWAETAKLKLKAAGIDCSNASFASASDARRRETIMRLAIRRAAARHRTKAFDSVIYFGDGIWDAKACANLRIPMIGVGDEVRGRRLIADGAQAVIPHFLPVDSVCQLLFRELSQCCSGSDRTLHSHAE